MLRSVERTSGREELHLLLLLVAYGVDRVGNPIIRKMAAPSSVGWIFMGVSMDLSMGQRA